MAEQQDMRAYVRQRMAGTEAAPVPPDANPMASYVLAQAHPRTGGMQVPPQTMMDSPQFLEEPDTGDEPVYKGTGPNVISNEDRHVAEQQARKERMDGILREMQALPMWRLFEREKLHGQFMKLYDEIGAAHTAGPVGRLMRKIDARKQGAESNVQDILEGANTQRAAPRQPLLPPAPGGVPLDAPRVPFVPPGAPMS